MNPPTRLSLLLTVLTAALLLAGCGGSEETTTTATRQAPTAADRAIARAAVLEPRDLPPDWTASDREAAGTIDCLPFNRMRTQAYAEAPDYHRRDGAFARNGVAIFPSPEQVERVVADAAADETLTCLAESVRRAAVEGATGDLTIGDVRAVRLDDPEAGEHSSAVRVTIPLRAEGRHIDVTADYVHVAVDRGISTLILGGAGAAPDAGVRLQLTLRTAERLDGALGGAS